MGHPASSRQGAPLGEGFLPHFVGGIDVAKSSLFTPYPAIPPYVVRTPHPGMADDREHIRRPESPREPRRAQESLGEPRREESPGEPRRSQERPREPRRAQESLGEPRRAQESPGEPRRAQGAQAEPPRRAKESPVKLLSGCCRVAVDVVEHKTKILNVKVLQSKAKQA